MEDVQIIRLYQDRNPEAIVQTKQKYDELCKTIAGRLLRSPEDAEECVNDTYLALWDAIPPATPSPLSAYIAKITRNLAMKRLEYLSADKRNPEVALSFDELDTCLPAPGGPEQSVQADALRQAITAFLQKQCRENRLIFLRRYFFFDSVNEISKRYRLSESKVKSSLLRTRHKLRIYLIKEGFDL